MSDNTATAGRKPLHPLATPSYLAIQGFFFNDDTFVSPPQYGSNEAADKNTQLTDDEISQMVQAYFDGITGDDLRERIDALVKLLKQNISLSESRKAESRRLRASSESMSRRAKFLKGELIKIADALKSTKLEGEVYNLTVCKNGGKEPLVDGSGQPLVDYSEDERIISKVGDSLETAHLVKTKKYIDTSAFREAVEGGDIDSSIAAIGERGRHLKIK